MTINEPFYAALCVFRHNHLDPKPGKKYLYEDRIILIHAVSVDDAIKKAELEAIEYADFHSEYLEFVNVYHLSDHILHHGSELYSTMRSSDLDPEDYIDHFHDSGFEHAETYD